LSWSEKALAIVLGIETTAPGTTGKATRAALKSGAKAIGAGTIRYAPVAASGIGSLASANPITAGTVLGAGVLATPPGQALLDAAAVRGAADRIAAQQAIDEAIFRATELPARQLQSAVTSPVFKPAVKRKVSKYSKSIKAGMAAVKASKFGGKKGKISNAKSVFSTVNKVASAVNKGKKVAKTGIRGVAARAIRRIL